MNKGQLVEAVATELDMSKAAASRAVEAVIGCITNGIKIDENVTIVGFGSFMKKQRSARTIRLQAEPSAEGGDDVELQARFLLWAGGGTARFPARFFMRTVMRRRRSLVIWR